MAKDLTLRQAQEEIRKFRRKDFPHWEEQTEEIEILDLIAEVGEFLEIYLRYQEEGAIFKSEEIEKGVGDILYSLMCVANKFNITIQKCLEQSLVSYHWDQPKTDPKLSSSKELNHTLKNLIESNRLQKLPNNIITIILDTGELAKTYLKMTNYGRAV
jgi:NTP pyrophosphatase (non-canonical NTP hydrolase)